MAGAWTWVRGACIGRVRLTRVRLTRVCATRACLMQGVRAQEMPGRRVAAFAASRKCVSGVEDGDGAVHRLSPGRTLV